VIELQKPRGLSEAKRAPAPEDARFSLAISSLLFPFSDRFGSQSQAVSAASPQTTPVIAWKFEIPWDGFMLLDRNPAFPSASAGGNQPEKY